MKENSDNESTADPMAAPGADPGHGESMASGPPAPAELVDAEPADDPFGRPEDGASMDPIDLEEGRVNPGRRRLLARLAGGLAHEIKNPLSTMAINLTLLEEEFQPALGGDHGQSPKDKRSLKRVRTLQREVARLEGILDDFLRFARGGEVNRSPLDLVDLVREVLEFSGPELEAADVRLHASLPTGLPLVMLDEGAFRQALVNLIVNARQAMPGGGELIVELRRHGRQAELCVTDSGVGMTPDQIERCFDLYYSTKKGGTGLGLATVKRIVEMHDGEMALVSDEGRGTRFHIWLPLLQELAVRRDAESTAAAEEESTSGPQGGPHNAGEDQ